MEWRRQLGADSPYSLGIALAYTRGRQYDTLDPETGLEEDVDFRRIPPLNGRVALRFDPEDDWHRIAWARLALRFADEQDHLHPQDESDPRIDPDGTEEWATVDLDVGGVLGEGGSWHAGLHNLFDADYRVHASGIDAPGLGFVVGVRLSR